MRSKKCGYSVQTQKIRRESSGSVYKLAAWAVEIGVALHGLLLRLKVEKSSEPSFETVARESTSDTLMKRQLQGRRISGEREANQ